MTRPGIESRSPGALDNYQLLASVVEGDQKAPFSIATTLRCSGERYSFPWIALLETYLIMMSVK